MPVIPAASGSSRSFGALDRCRHFFTISALIALAFSTPAVAEPRAIGVEYAVEDRALPAKEWWTICRAADGSTSTISPACVEEKCEQGDLRIQRVDEDGKNVGPAVQVNRQTANLFSYRLTCHASGRIVAQWQDSATGCFLHRALDARGKLAGEPIRTIGEDGDCRVRTSLALREDGRFISAWPAARIEGGSAIFSRWFDADGKALTDRVVVSDADVAWRYRPKIAIDDNGISLIAWSNRADYGVPAPVLGHFLDEDGNPFGPTFQINTYAYGENSEPAIVAKGGGLFEVVWSNRYQGGRVARLVSLDGAEIDSTDTTAETLPPPDDMPRFVSPRVVDSLPQGWYDVRPRQLDVGAPSTWVLGQQTLEYWRTHDDGIEWEGPDPLLSEDYGFADGVVAGGDGAFWLRLLLPFGGNELWYARSVDGAATWTSVGKLAEGGHISEGCSHCSVIRTDGRGTSSGTWLATWTFRDFIEKDSGENEEIERIYVVRSKDHGKSWGSEAKLASDQGVGRWGLDIDGDGKGTWVAMWADADLRAAVSRDDGRTWSAPATLADAVSCDDCGSQHRYSRVTLSHDGNGSWLGVFSSASYRTSTYGYDGDVFVVRSSDNGATWSEPVAVSVDAAHDANRDFEPTLATDPSGRTLLMWTSHRPLGTGDDMDADVFAVMSTDMGMTWSAPVNASAGAGDDHAMATSPLLAADERGVWLAAWQSSPFVLDPSSTYLTDRVLATIADSTCGDAIIDVGEACDDGNAEEGDGCDSNCTLTGCGNGIVTDGESCDAGSAREIYDCFECRAPVCGDGFVFPNYEECDDGNDIATDECTTACRFAACGDGFVHEGVEECDDGLGGFGACGPECHLPVCGDGYIHKGVEACDDGNRIDDDACPNDCSKAVCGDGYTSYGFEECDYKDPAYLGACAEDCTLPQVCGDANADEIVTASDARVVLRSAVGIPVVCPRTICDMDASGRVTVTDAKMDLHKSVGIPVGERCSIGTGNIVFSIDNTVDVGAIQIDVEYGPTGGFFVGSADSVACDMLLSGLLASFNDNDETKILSAGIIALAGFQGPVDMFRCQFVMPEDRSGVRFFVRVVDAATPDLNPITPVPLISYRLE